MKSLRLIVICFLAAFCASNIHAQGVKIYKKDKTVIEVPYNELDSIVAVEAFEEEMEFVDLGLSVKWASKNVGAKLPEDYGDYFAWAETAPKKEYTDDNCTSSGQKMGDIAGKTEFDAAAAIIGDGARLPTKAELEELLNNCTTEWVTRNGVEGRLVTSKKNGNSIFMPAAGIRNGSKTNFLGLFGSYWTSTPKDGQNNMNAFYLDFNISYFDWNVYNRFHGNSIRAVRK